MKAVRVFPQRKLVSWIKPASTRVWKAVQSGMWLILGFDPSHHKDYGLLVWERLRIGLP